MKKLSWMAAAATIITVAWVLSVPPSDIPTSQPPENPPLLAIVNNLNTPHVQTAFRDYQRCCRLIEQNFQRLETLQQIAGECHLNASYLSRVFQSYARQTPEQYLARVKRKQAAASS